MRHKLAENRPDHLSFSNPSLRTFEIGVVLAGIHRIVEERRTALLIPSMKNGAVFGILCSVLLSGLTSCRESFKEVASRHRAGLSVLRADMQHLKQQALDPIQKAKPLLPLDPLPVFESADLSGNTLILSWQELDDPNGPITEENLPDLHFSSAVKRVFQLTNQAGESDVDFEEELISVVSVRYLVGYRILRYESPQFGEDRHYRRGGALVDVQVFDRRKKANIRSFEVTALSDENMDHLPDVSAKRPVEMRDLARANLLQNLRKQLLATLAERTGGKFSS